MLFKERIKGLKRYLRENYIFVGVFLCFLWGVEMLRLPVYGATFITLLTCAPGSYDFVDTFAGLAVVVADALMLSLPALFVSKRKWILFAWIGVFDVFCIIQRMYAAVYMDLMPFSHLLLFDNVNTVLIDSAVGLLSIKDLLVFIPLLALIAVDWKLKGGKRYGKKSVILSIAVAFVGYFLAGVNNVLAISNDDYSLLQPYTTVYKTRGYVCDNGLVPYAVFSFVNAVLPENLSEEELAEVDKFISEIPKYRDNTYSQGEKNLIVVVVESMNSWLFNREVNGVRIMPHLDSLMRCEGTISALKVFPQVKDGRSSDGHFIINTGLLPLSSGSVATSYCHPYPSLAKALKSKGYASFNMVCDDRLAWNQEKLSYALGFDTIYDSTIGGKRLDRIEDCDMFSNAVQKLKAMPQPFYAQLVTISTHQPGYKTDKPTALSQYKIQTDRVINALENFHTLDVQLWEFIEELKANGLYDNSVIIIVSDHNDVNYNEFAGVLERIPEDTYCSFIALNTNVSKSLENVYGQVDIYPTILDIMGLNDYRWKGLGYSMLREVQPNVAAYCDGTFAGYAQSPLADRCKRAWKISSMIIKGNVIPAGC